jgi:formylglycine-generating enzyme required for sulfatase activity
MNLSATASSAPIGDFGQLLHDNYQLDLSPLEIAEIIWLAVQRGEEYEPQGTQPAEKGKKKVEGAGDQSSTGGQQKDVGQKEKSDHEKVDVVTKLPPATENQEKPVTPLPIEIPEAVALRNRREIGKGMRPLMRKVPSRTRQMIDEEATAIQIAEDKIWIPVVKPELERWLELAIVIEVTNLVEVWQEPISEFQHLLERHGAFRDVRTWQLRSGEDSEGGQPQLFLQTANGLNRSPRSPRELLDPGGRRLVLVVSDCTSQAWRSGKILKLLELWSRENPVTIAQLLPELYWDRSALGWDSFVMLHSQLPGARSRDWILSGLSSFRRDQLQGGLRVPVITIQPQAIAQWAAAMTGVGEQETIGVVLRSDMFEGDWSELLETEQLTGTARAKYLVQRFRGTASGKAQRLAKMMAVLPVNWSVLRLLQKNLMEYTPEDTGALYLAEIFLSGLLRPVEQKLNESGVRQQFDFVEGVRSVLLGAVPIFEARAIGEKFATEIFQQLPVEVQERVNRDIERRWPESLSYFEAFLVPDLPWGEEAKAEMLPFAQVTGEVLRRWGGQYAILAEELESKRANVFDPGAKTEDGFWQWAKFEVKTIEFSDELQLESYKFEVTMLRFTEEVLEIEDVFRVANGAMQARTHEKLNALQEEIIDGTWQHKSYAEIADREGLSVSHVSREGAMLFRGLSEELGKSISKNNMVEVFGKIVGKSVRVGYEIVRLPGHAEQFAEPLGSGVELEMVRIPAGDFMMGSPQQESERYKDESPQHLVTVPEFYLGKYPVTQSQWRLVADLPQVERELQREPSNFKGDDLPVEQVSWFDVQEFCQRLSVLTGREYRLPSEAEWEYACRAGTTTPFHFGEMISTDVANYNGDYVYGIGEKGIYRGKTTPVGSFNAANNFGLYDMHGNVLEWCLDHYHSDYEGAPIDGSAWIDPNAEQDAYRELRGGSWVSDPQNCRSACRNYYVIPVGHVNYVGFRVVCEAARTP